MTGTKHSKSSTKRHRRAYRHVSHQHFGVYESRRQRRERVARKEGAS